MDIIELSRVFQSHPSIQPYFTFDKVALFCDLIRLMRQDIEWSCIYGSLDPPERLPLRIHEFLMDCLGIPHEECKVAWFALRSLAWGSKLSDHDERQLRARYAKYFMKYGISRNIGVFNLFPPSRSCLDPKCTKTRKWMEIEGNLQRELTDPIRIAVTVFTKGFGPVPSYAISAYCRYCRTRYHHNYYVHNSASQRTFYHDMPQLIQPSKHFYVESEVCELFATMMCSAWTSATNCSRIYNATFRDEELKASLPASWQSHLDLTCEDVWRAFYVYSLWLDHSERGTTLTVPHKKEHPGADRLEQALEARNLLMAGTGQEAWNHACDDCCRMIQGDDGITRQIRSVVVDGITIGCPCCNVHDCPNPLASVRDRFCPTHKALEERCSVDGCAEPASNGFKTCSDPKHRQLETYSAEHGKAMFQLKRRLQRLRASHTHDALDINDKSTSSSVSEGLGLDRDEDIVLDDNGPHLADEIDDRTCNSKSSSGNVKVRARFHRRLGHNEETVVASCGVILARATMFGSEAANGVRAFLMRVFPTQSSLPQVIWHDNACSLQKMLKQDTDKHLRHYFDKCAMPVDVFHFKSKHKETDEFCGQHCNPALWPELMTDDGKWTFNSSAAEQCNGWLGGYQAIVREMRVARYNFFLDEMIKCRNRLAIAELRRRGRGPWSMPRDVLLEQN